MKIKSSRRAVTSGVLVASGLLLQAGCVSGTPSGRGGYRASRDVEVQSTMMLEDDYDYYPGYEIYYSRNRHEYVYRDRNRWVRNSEPGGVPLSALHASPFVRVDFRDSPERHHAAIVRNYPRNWHGPSNRPDEHRKENRDKQDRKDDERDDRNDDRR